jgi:hypothetical protein
VVTKPDFADDAAPLHDDQHGPPVVCEQVRAQVRHLPSLQVASCESGSIAGETPASLTSGYSTRNVADTLAFGTLALVASGSPPQRRVDSQANAAASRGL